MMKYFLAIAITISLLTFFACSINADEEEMIGEGIEVLRDIEDSDNPFLLLEKEKSEKPIVNFSGGILLGGVKEVIDENLTNTIVKGTVFFVLQGKKEGGVLILGIETKDRTEDSIIFKGYEEHLGIQSSQEEATMVALEVKNGDRFIAMKSAGGKELLLSSMKFEEGANILDYSDGYYNFAVSDGEEVESWNLGVTDVIKNIDE